MVRKPSITSFIKVQFFDTKMIFIDIIIVFNKGYVLLSAKSFQPAIYICHLLTNILIPQVM